MNDFICKEKNDFDYGMNTYPVIETLQGLKCIFIWMIYFVYYEWYSEKSNDFVEVFSKMDFILNGQPIQKVILTLILPKAIDVNALHFLMHLKRIIELWV